MKNPLWALQALALFVSIILDPLPLHLTQKHLSPILRFTTHLIECQHCWHRKNSHTIHHHHLFSGNPEGCARLETAELPLNFTHKPPIYRKPTESPLFLRWRHSCAYPFGLRENRRYGVKN
jgi:hypothetical protein